MTAPVVVLTDRNREHAAWLQARRTGIGGSEAAAVCGLSRWKSPLSVWLHKTGWDVEQAQSEAMGWGLALEEPIRKEVARRLAAPILAEQQLYRASDPAFMLASPDAIVLDGKVWAGVLEIKLVGPRQLAAWEEGPPVEVELQLQHYLSVLGRDRGWIAALLGGVELGVWEMDRDPEIEGMLLEREAAFWRLVTDQLPPAVIGTAEERDALRAAFPALDGEAPVPLDAEAQAWLRRRALAVLEEKEAEQRRLQAENEIRLALQGARAGQVGGRVVIKLTSYERQTIDAASLRAEQPDIASRYTKTSVSERWWVPRDGS